MYAALDAGSGAIFHNGASNRDLVLIMIMFSVRSQFTSSVRSRIFTVQSLMFEFVKSGMFYFITDLSIHDKTHTRKETSKLYPSSRSFIS